MKSCRVWWATGTTTEVSSFIPAAPRFNAVYADAGYTGVERREEHENREVIWQITARRSMYSWFNKRRVLYKAKRKIEYCKAQTRAKVEHSFRVIKRQFGYVKVRLLKQTSHGANICSLLEGFPENLHDHNAGALGEAWYNGAVKLFG